MKLKVISDFTNDDNQDRIREELLYWMRQLPYWETKELANIIGISPNVLRQFLKGFNASFNTLAKIENWIEEQKRLNPKG